MCSWAAKSSNNHSVLNRIMLRFRPIAPKPVGGESASVTAEQERASGAWGRTKRKYVRVRGRRSKQPVRRTTTDDKKVSPTQNSESSPEKEVVTLQLLPERSEGDDKSCDNSVQNIQNNLNINRFNVDDDVNFELTAESGGGAVDLRSVRSVVETWIIVECVTERFTGVGLGFSDEEKIHHLEHDTCPGFISDGTNNVIWVNEAYKKMVAGDEHVGAEKGFLVWLVVKEELPYFYPSFACRVRLIQHRGQGHKWNKTVACDVWRMEFAGFAWKLDVNTALSLSL
ncbi:hypothetical protein CDL12_17739 [Handroanthus impetiginosus]|uniref:DUF7950 domain-containing protein n=1 Tax=Handroanthus impetiginosus TaxID=429701 RepID=A0A2G9GWL2_9LAMI|nr:hypothetical protein CDL12_17739 [Handroanthus impetiginosus]